jgi:hypothetical protein
MTVYNTLRQLPETLWNKLDKDDQRYAQLIWKRDAGEFFSANAPKRYAEIAGDCMLFPTVDLPRKLAAQTMFWIGAETAVAVTLFAVGFFANPVSTTALVGRTIASLPSLSKLLAGASIFGLVCRTVGRMFNTGLMKSFYNNVYAS